MNQAPPIGHRGAVDNPRIVDLFAGPGGLDVAAHWLGIPSIGVEFDPAAVETRTAAGLTTVAADVAELHPSDFAGANILVGGPPCQTFTVAGTGHGRRALDTVLKLVEMLGAGDFTGVDAEVATMSDIRTGLVLEPLVWAMLTHSTGLPFQAIVLEQVPAVRPVWEAMAAVLEGIGYRTAVDVLRTEEYGVPQTRRRAILIARYQPSAPVRMPKPTHQLFDRRLQKSPAENSLALDYDSSSSGRRRWVSMAEALGEDRPFRLRSNYGQGGDPKRRGIRHHDEPSFTMTGKATRNRMVFDGDSFELITPQQAGRLQTFPPDYPWRGKDISQQVGNAVPPRMGVHVLAAALGLDPGLLTEEFFADRLRSWVPPTEDQRRQAEAIHTARSMA